MSQSKKKNYKKRKPAAHIQQKKNAGVNPNQKTVKEVSQTEQFLDNWLWLITLVAIIIIGVLLVVFIPKIDSCATNCADNRVEETDNDAENLSFTDLITSDGDSAVSAADAATTTTTTTTTVTTTTAPPLDLTSFDPNEYTDQFRKPADGEQIAVFDTSMGVIKMRLFPDAAPKSVENFKKHISDGYYNGTIFHRVINNFMIQGGDPKGDGTGGESIWGGTFEDEYSNGLYNFRGALSMANTGAVNTNGSQFFIVQNNNLGGDMSADGMNIYTQYIPEWAAKTYFKIGGYPMGDHEFYPGTNYNGHTVFGQVFEGMDVVDAIAAVSVDSTTYRPASEVRINRAYLENYKG